MVQMRTEPGGYTPKAKGMSDPRANSEGRTVFVPLEVLKRVLTGARSHCDEKRELEEQLAANTERVCALNAKTIELEQKLVQYKTIHRQSVIAQPSHRNLNSNGNPVSRFSSMSSIAPVVPVKSPTSWSALIPAKPKSPAVVERQGTSGNNDNMSPTNSLVAKNSRVIVLKERVTQLEQVMASVKEISAQGEFSDVIGRTLSAVRKLVHGDKYTLGLLNERRNIIEIFSIMSASSQEPKPTGKDERSPSLRKIERGSSLRKVERGPSVRKMNASKLPYECEGFVAADSATTFGRVIMTGKLLKIEDFYTHENYDHQMRSTGINAQALICVPIRNAHNAIVGVFQVVCAASASDATNNNVDEVNSSFSESDTKILKFLAVVAGSALWNLILLRERQTAQNRIEGLLKLHRNISMEAVSSSVLDQVLSVCHELIGTERIGLFMKIEGEDELYIACAADIVRGEYVPITKGIVGYVARTGETVITNNAYSHPMFDPTLDHKTGFVTKRILCLPVRSPEGAILAVLSAVNKIDGTDFSSEDAIFLNYAADAVGISLHKASLHHEVKTSQKLIEARLKLTTFIAESSDIAEFADLVMVVGKDIMNCDRFGLLLIDHFKKELWITPGVSGASIRMPMNRGISGLVATTGQPICTRDAYKHELFDPNVDIQTGYRTTSVLCMPIFEDTAITTPKCVAVAMCINKKEGAHVVAFTKTDCENMEKYCREVQFALGRLSLDISYYKVVSDCVALGTSSSENGLPDGASGSDQPPSILPSTMRMDTYSETDIISSIVHKYCQSDLKPGNSGAPSSSAEDVDEDGEQSQRSSSMSIASVVPALLKKKEEDDLVPFPRDIAFANTVDEPLDQWDMETSSLSNSDIGMCCGIIFRAYGFFESFRISGEKFVFFTTNVANYYRSNPFHNFQHGFQVMLTMHIMIRTECRKFFSGVEIFSMLIAALCHDIDHPGNTNDFELKTLSPMAMTHNDDAVLERHHCRVTFIILNHKSAKILQYLDEARYKRVRQLIISCILATDMSKHHEKCKLLEGLTRRQLTEKRAQFMGILIHAADLSHQTLPFKQASEWCFRLLDEFQNQAKVEADQGVSSDFFMQNLENKKTRLIVQMNYINYVVRPIWLPLASLCHHLRVSTVVCTSPFV